MSRASSQMHLTILGMFLVVVGVTGSVVATPSQRAVRQQDRSSSQESILQVVPGTNIPSTSSASQLQGAQSVQNVRPSNLQQSAQADSLQPNAKTDTFTTTKSVQ